MRRGVSVDWNNDKNAHGFDDDESKASRRLFGSRSLSQIYHVLRFRLSQFWVCISSLYETKTAALQRIRKPLPTSRIGFLLFLSGFLIGLIVCSTNWYLESGYTSRPRRDASMGGPDVASTSFLGVRSPWMRIRPRSGETVYGEKEDFRIGKSCHWRKKFPFLFFSRYYWDCRDCGTFTNDWSRCRTLARRKKCPSFPFQDWDGPKPRSSSTYEPYAALPHPVRLVTSYGVGKVRRAEYEQAQCPSELRGPCWDLRRCTSTTHTGTKSLMLPLPIYAYSGLATDDLESALLLDSNSPRPHEIRRVFNVEEACLLIAHNDNIEDVIASSSWNGGRNHYVYGITRPITGTINYGMAALGSVVATNAQIRWGYDIPLPLPALWSPPTALNQIAQEQTFDHHYPRRLLLSFRGSIQDTLQPYYQHRWLAAEYLHEEPRAVEINVQCKHKTWYGDLITSANYDSPEKDGASTFDDLMVNSTFGFCPGGSHVTSFRFTEVLSAGGIPVILPEIATPFAPELDWSGCVMVVSQSRIVDLPRILRGISDDEIRARRDECQRLYKFIRNDPGKQLGLRTTLHVWMTRLKQAVGNDNLLHETFV